MQALSFVRIKKEIDTGIVPVNNHAGEDGTPFRTLCTADGVALDEIEVIPTLETLVCRFPKGDGEKSEGVIRVRSITP